ncbi:hypothetical protein SD208_16880 [Ochrobactrum sp. BD67]
MAGLMIEQYAIQLFVEQMKSAGSRLERFEQKRETVLLRKNPIKSIVRAVPAIPLNQEPL